MQQQWQELAWNVSAAEQPRLEEILEAHGALSISIEDARGEAAFESALGRAPDWQQVQVRALFDAAHETDDLRQSVASAVPQVSAAAARSFADRDWVGEWSRQLRVQCIDDRIWIVPGALPAPPGATRVLRLDPGLAFGSGTHDTTRLCLSWLAQTPLRGLTVLDYGCGSGILGIAALLLGAERVFACDTDPQAITVTADNARRNGVDDRLLVGTPASVAAQHCDVVVANILLQALVDYAPQFATQVRPGGRVLLSGVLGAQVPELLRAFAPAWEAFGVRHLQEWACVHARRRAVTAACGRLDAPTGLC